MYAIRSYYVRKRTGHSTFGVTENGLAKGKLLGMLTGRDYRIGRDSLNTQVKDLMTPFSKLIYGQSGISLNEANDIIWNHKLNCLPILNENQELEFFVFRKDYDSHKAYPLELIDSNKKLLVGAGISYNFV